MPHFLMLFDCFISDLKLNLALLDCFSPLLIDIFILIISFNALILINKLIIETIQDIAESHNIAQVLHWNVLTGQNDELDKLTSVKDEYKNNITVLECYQKTFFRSGRKTERGINVYGSVQ